MRHDLCARYYLQLKNTINKVLYYYDIVRRKRLANHAPKSATILIKFFTR